MFDVEEMEQLAAVADECKCKLTTTYVDEAIDAESLMDDMRRTWATIQNALGDNVRIWTYCYLTDDEDIKVKFKDGKIQAYFVSDGKLSKDEINEDLDDDVTYTEHEMDIQLRDNHVYETESGSFNVCYPEEKEHCKKLLRDHGFKFEVSGDMGKYHFEYWKDSDKKIFEAFGTQKFDIEFVDKATGEDQKAVIRGKDQDDAIKRFFKKPWNVECEITSIVPHGQKKKDAVAAAADVKDEEPVNV